MLNFSHMKPRSALWLLFGLMLVQLGSITARADIKEDVDALILVHGNQLGAIADSIPSGRLQIGRGDVVNGNMGMLHAREVAQIINDDSVTEGARLMEECCWRPQPAIYPNFVVSSMQDILSANQISPPVAPEDLYNPEDAPDTLSTILLDAGRPTIPIPTTYADHMASVFDQMVRVRDGYVGGLPGADSMDQFTYDWMSALTAGIPTGFNFTNGTLLPPDSLASRLIWNWSYELKKYRQFREGVGTYDPHPQAFLDTFRDYYNWACTVCAGAGFYDTIGMYDLNADGVYVANEYYDAIVALLSDTQKTWLAEQYHEGFMKDDGMGGLIPAPPLQVSFGLTLQSQQSNNPPVRDSDATYGTHCHTAEEVYIPVDPMALDKNVSDGMANILDGEEGSEYNTNSYMAGLPNTSGAAPIFQPFDSMQLKVDDDIAFADTFTQLTNGDIVYWGRRAKHAMFSGQRFQFAAWARVNRPFEGTFFPEDIDLADATIDTEDGQPYWSTCRRDAPAPQVYLDICGNPESFYDNVQIVTQSAGVVLTGTTGNDLLVANTDGDSQIDGLGGQDCLIGGAGNDTILGKGGNDVIAGRGGNDNLLGGANHDTITGGDGNDTIKGGNGHDELFGGDGDDFMRGFAGNDLIDGQAGADTIQGDPGNDTCSNQPEDTVTTCEVFL